MDGLLVQLRPAWTSVRCSIVLGLSRPIYSNPLIGPLGKCAGGQEAQSSSVARHSVLLRRCIYSAPRSIPSRFYPGKSLCDMFTEANREGTDCKSWVGMTTRGEH